MQNNSSISISKKTHNSQKAQNEPIGIKVFVKNRCSTLLPVHIPMSLLHYNMKSLMSWSHQCVCKTPFAFMDFLLALCICVSCSCWREMGSLFIVFIHFISTTVLTEGLWNRSHSHRNNLLWLATTVPVPVPVHDFVDTMNSGRDKGWGQVMKSNTTV